MEEKILEVLRNHPDGMRLREIGGELNVWHCSLLPMMSNLVKSGKVREQNGHDIANCEYWTKYFAVGA